MWYYVPKGDSMNKNFDFQKSFKDFLIVKNVSGYDNCLNSFKAFLSNQNITNNDMAKIYFQGLRAEKLIDSLEYYIDSNGVTSFGAASKYSSCIREYFLELVQKEHLKNDELMSEFAFKTYDSKSYRYKVNVFLNEKKEIIKGDGFETFEKIDDLIKDCDSTMNDRNVLSKISTSKYFNKYRSALIIKLILLTGVTYKTITEIKECDLDLNHSSITINNLTIHLPNNMTDQFKEYMKIRNQLTLISDRKPINLFIENNTSPISETTSITTNFLCGLTGRNDLSGIIKYAIINMIKKGINQNIITTFTGVGDTIYSNCQSEVNKAMDLKTSSYLDSKIRSIEVFNLL